MRQRVLGQEHPDTLRSINNLGLILADQRQLPEAEASFLRAYELRRKVLGETNPETVATVNELVKLYDVWSKSDKAASWRAKLTR